MLRTGQPDKMLRDLRNTKRSRELSATLMEILVSGENHNILNPVLSLCMLECLAKVGDRNVTASLLLQPTLLAEAIITFRLVIPFCNAAFRQSVPSQILFSITYSFVAPF
jgi:hypothetical protein